ncbi:MAG: deoxyribonuclease IV [Solirubrobacterales bacterium]|nr:deoxyribonuclease IV [Solirubrobacterales bacterium]
MLIGAHVSPAGGLPKAVERGVQRGCHAIQIFNQSPRAWRPTTYAEDDVAAFREALAESEIGAVLIHAVYLLNCASEDRDIREKSLESLTHSLRTGARIGARGVVLHPGSAKNGDTAAAIARAGETIREALAESEDCALHLENTAGAGGTLGRSIGELGALIEAIGGDRRVGICLDSCHLYASGYDIRTPAGMDGVLGEVRAEVGLDRLGSLHLNDSQGALGSNRDRHANIGKGELGERGCGAFLSAEPFDSLACVLETKGDGKGSPAEDVALAMNLRERGVKARKRRRAAGASGRRARRPAPAARGRSSR